MALGKRFGKKNCFRVSSVSWYSDRQLEAAAANGADEVAEQGPRRVGSWRHSASGAARGLRAGGAPVTDQRRPQGRADEEGENQDEEDVAAAAKVAGSLMKHLRPSFSGAPSGDGTDDRGEGRWRGGWRRRAPRQAG